MEGNGQTLNFVVITDGDSTPFQGLAYNHREPLSAAANESDIGDAVKQLKDALRSLDTAGAGSQSVGDTGAMSQALGEMLAHLGQ